MTSGLKGSSSDTVTWRITLPKDLAARIELMIFDHISKRPAYGAKSALVVQLLKDWADSRRKVSAK